MLHTLFSHKHFKHVLYILVVVLILAGILLSPRLATSPVAVVENSKESLSVPDVISEVQVGNTIFSVGIADTADLRARGLSGKEGLSDNEGLLFVFEEEGIYPFWMKDMLFNIDIVWISEDGQIVYIQSRATPESFPQTFKPSAEALYVLEVNAGIFEKGGIEVGDIVSFK